MNSWQLSFDLFIHIIFTLSNEQLILLIIQNRKGNTITIYNNIYPLDPWTHNFSLSLFGFLNDFLSSLAFSVHHLPSLFNGFQNFSLLL